MPSEPLSTKECAYYNSLNLPRIIKCLSILSEDDVWLSPNKNTNSIANLILHLNGNITQYILAGLGGVKDQRDRNSEFSVSSGHSKDELYKILERTVLGANEIIRHLSPEKLAKKFMIQGFEITGMGAIVHVTEHLSYHTGQIALMTKIIKDEDLGFYSGTDLNITNG